MLNNFVCVIAGTRNFACAEQIITDHNVMILYDPSFQNISNKQNLLNYGSKYGNDGHDSSGWIVDIENTDFLNNTQSGNDNGSLIKDCSSSFVLNNSLIQGNTATGTSPIINAWKGIAQDVSDGLAPNYDGVITFIDSSIKDNKGYMLFQLDAIGNVVAQNADDLAVGVSNSGNLNLYSGTLDKAITGNGTTHVQGVVTIAKTINDNILSIDSAVGSSASVANMGITSVGKTVTNGGDLNLQYLNCTEAYSLGNVTLSSDAALAIDVDLTGSSAVKQTRYFLRQKSEN